MEIEGQARLAQHIDQPIWYDKRGGNADSYRLVIFELRVCLEIDWSVYLLIIQKYEREKSDCLEVHGTSCKFHEPFMNVSLDCTSASVKSSLHAFCDIRTSDLQFPSYKLPDTPTKRTDL